MKSTILVIIFGLASGDIGGDIGGDIVQSIKNWEKPAADKIMHLHKCASNTESTRTNL